MLFQIWEKVMPYSIQRSITLACSLRPDLGKLFFMYTVRRQLWKKWSRIISGLSDDLVALYLTNPELFSINTMTDRLNVRYAKDYDLPGVKEAIGDMIKGTILPAAILYSADSLCSVNCSGMISVR